MKNYKCPYCNFSDNRDELISHIGDEHEDIIPEKFTASRLVFNIVNKREAGVCVVCKKETDWSEDNRKYNRMCNDKKCKIKLRENYKNNMLRVRGVITMLGDTDHQQKMLANRRISGTYTFTDGGKHTYTGKYEQKALEFFDKVLNVHSDDLMCPGPVFEYDNNGKKLKWITDMLYIPFNLVIEVKDGGDNPNNRNMEEYREKQVNKEKMITNLGTYNYLRLTNNNFVQLMETLAELKYQMIDDTNENKKVVININEMSCPGGMPSANGSGDGYIISYGLKNTFVKDDIEGFAVSNDISSDKVLIVDKDGNIRSESSSILDGRKVNVYKFLGERANYVSILKNVNTNIGEANPISYFYEQLTGNEMLTKDQIDYDNLFKDINLDDIISETTALASSVIQEFNKLNNSPIAYLPLIKPSDVKHASKLLEGYNDLDILEDVNGYFVCDMVSETRSISYKDIKDIGIKGVIKNGSYSRQ